LAGFSISYIGTIVASSLAFKTQDGLVVYHGYPCTGPGSRRPGYPCTGPGYMRPGCLAPGSSRPDSLGSGGLGPRVAGTRPLLLEPRLVPPHHLHLPLLLPGRVHHLAQRLVAPLLGDAQLLLDVRLELGEVGPQARLLVGAYLPRSVKWAEPVKKKK